MSIFKSSLVFAFDVELHFLNLFLFSESAILFYHSWALFHMTHEPSQYPWLASQRTDSATLVRVLIEKTTTRTLFLVPLGTFATALSSLHFLCDFICICLPTRFCLDMRIGSNSLQGFYRPQLILKFNVIFLSNTFDIWRICQGWAKVPSWLHLCAWICRALTLSYVPLRSTIYINCRRAALWKT